MNDPDYDEWLDECDEPCGSCYTCGCNLYAYEDDGSGLCDQCYFYANITGGWDG